MSKSDTQTANFQVHGKSWTLQFVKKKEGGANDAGEHGGIYSYSDSDSESTPATQEPTPKKRMLLKSETAEKDMAEFLASKIFEATAPDNSARVVLATESNGGKVYIGSIYLDGYKDLFEETNARLSIKKNGRTFAAGTVNAITGHLRAKMLGQDGNPKYEGFAQCMATSLLVGDFDVHTGNIGILNGTKLARIDYAAAFDRLKDEFDAHSISEHPFGAGPTNHFREYPRKLRITKAMSDECLKVAAMAEKIDSQIDAAFAEMSAVYKYEDFKNFGKRTFGDREFEQLENEILRKCVIESPVLLNKDEVEIEASIKSLKEPGSHQEALIKDTLVEAIKTKTQKKMHKRQESLREFGLEVGLSACFNQKGELREGENKKNLEDFIKNHPEYIDSLIKGQKEIHYRASGILSKLANKLHIYNTNKNILDRVKSVRRELEEIEHSGATKAASNIQTEIDDTVASPSQKPDQAKKAAATPQKDSSTQDNSAEATKAPNGQEQATTTPQSPDLSAQENKMESEEKEHKEDKPSLTSFINNIPMEVKLLMIALMYALAGPTVAIAGGLLVVASETAGKNNSKPSKENRKNLVSKQHNAPQKNIPTPEKTIEQSKGTNLHTNTIANGNAIKDSLTARKPPSHSAAPSTKTETHGRTP